MLGATNSNDTHQEEQVTRIVHKNWNINENSSQNKWRHFMIKNAKTIVRAA